MNRPFLLLLVSSWAAIGCSRQAVTDGRVAEPPRRRAVAVTIDDLPTISVVAQTIDSRGRLIADLVRALVAHRVPAIGFVNEDKLGEWGHADARQVALLEAWAGAGLELGNHTWSHVGLHQVSLEQYLQEILRGDEITRAVLGKVGKSPRYFRHPFLHTGRDSVTRDSVDHFLTAHGYTVAPVTIDNYDYLFAAAYDRLGAAGDSTAADSLATIYIDYMVRAFAYYEKQSVDLLGREPPQILLLHANWLNARTFDRLATALQKRGYSFISLDSALTDSAYRRPDRYYGTAGISWLHRWAITDGKRGSYFAGEPEVPAWVEQAARP